MEVWKNARELCKKIRFTVDNTPLGTDYSIKNQILRSSGSIMDNIAEGFERRSDADFARFLDIAKGSCGEVRSMYYTAMDFTYVSDETVRTRQEQARSIAAGTGSLLKHLRKKNP